MCILCYHGIARRDEHLWNPRLFIDPLILRRRFEIIKKTGFPVLSLNDAVNALEKDDFPDNAIVITFDDGFYNNYDPGLSILDDYQFPITLYVASHHIEEGTPVFRHIVSYLLWLARDKEVNLSSLTGGEITSVDLANHDLRYKVQRRLTVLENALTTSAEKLSFCFSLAELLHEDFQRVLDERLFSFMTSDELKKFVRPYISLGLHTHSHPFEMNQQMLLAELRQNREYLTSLIPSEYTHFCYPSGNWSREMLPLLAKQGIRSATTCDPGLNSVQVNLFTLKRYLDSQSSSDVELLAELYGFAEAIRIGTGRSKSLSVFHSK